MTKPAVSVLLNSYNQGEFLAEAIESVLNQTFSNFELIITDNGSTDGSAAIARGYASDPRVKLVLHSENRSLSQRQNEAVALARGEFVSFLYSDDVYLPHKLERQMQLFQSLSDEWGVVYAPPLGFNIITNRRWQHVSVGKSGFILEDIIANDGRGIDMLSPLTRRICFSKYPFYDDLFAEGEAVFHRIAMSFKFFHCDEPVVVLREHTRNIGKSVRNNHENFMKVLDRMERHPNFPDKLKRLLPSYRARLLRNAGWQVARTNGDMVWARERFLRSAMTTWTGVLHPRAFIGMALTFLPPIVREALNAFGTTIRKPVGNPVSREGYE